MMNIDNSDLIKTIRQHIDSGHKGFPSNTPRLLKLARKVIAEKTASPEQQAELVALEKELRELAELPPPLSPPSFMSSTAG